MRRRIVSVLAVLLTVAGLAAPAAQACSRVTWLGPDGMVITGRSMDWPYSFNSHLYAIPRGLDPGRSRRGELADLDRQVRRHRGRRHHRPQRARSTGCSTG